MVVEQPGCRGYHSVDGGSPSVPGDGGCGRLRDTIVPSTRQPAQVTDDWERRREWNVISASQILARYQLISFWSKIDVWNECQPKAVYRPMVTTKLILFVLVIKKCFFFHRNDPKMHTRLPAHANKSRIYNEYILRWNGPRACHFREKRNTTTDKNKTIYHIYVHKHSISVSFLSILKGIMS